MPNRTIKMLCLLLVLGFAGCAGPGMNAGWPEPRPLGRDFESYRPPQKLVSTVSPATRLEEPIGTLTLPQALALALMNNPELAAFSWEVRAREARALQTGRLPNPELEVELENFGGTGASGGFDESEASVQLSQLVELAGKRSKRKRVATFEKELAGWDYETGRIHVFTETSKAFVDVLATQERLTLNEELVRLAEQVLDAVSERVKAGKVSAVEETRARVALASRRIDRDKAQEDFTVAQQVLAAFWGGRVLTYGEVEGNLEHLPSIPSKEALDDRISDNPELARWLVELESRRASVELEKSMRFPDLTLNGGVLLQNEADDTAFVVGLSLPIPAFDRNQGGILESQYKFAQAEEEHRALTVRLQTTLTCAYQRLSSARKEAASLKNDVLPGARSASEAISEGFHQGKFGFLDVLNAQQTFFEAKAHYLDALSDFHKAVADVERLTGEPLDTAEDPAKGSHRGVIE